MRPHCPRCKQANPIKNGFVCHKQRWRCRGCAYEFTRSSLPGRSYYPVSLKKAVSKAYESGWSSTRVARYYGVSEASVLNWARYYSDPTCRVHILHIDRLKVPISLKQVLDVTSFVQTVTGK